MTSVNNIFIELLQVAIGNSDLLSSCPTDEEWEMLYDMAKKQVLVGVCFYGVKCLPQEQLPPARRLRQWAVKAMRLEDKNARVSRECSVITEVFQKGRYESCVLKGQGNTTIYPAEIAKLRTPGDIDLWVFHKDKELDRKRLVRAIWRLSRKRLDVAVHHAECEVFRKTPVEVHFTPSFSLNPWTDWKMQRYWEENKSCMIKTDEGYNIPDTRLNLVFQMSHVFRHLLLEGIGFRQLVDYYFLLMRFRDENGDKGVVMKDIKMLSMKKISSAVMWIMKEVFLMKEEYLLCEPSERYGKEMLGEILEGGNFGHHFENKAERELDDEGKETTASKFEGNWETIKRGMKLVKSYPSECLWVPWLCIRASVVRNYWRRVKE